MDQYDRLLQSAILKFIIPLIATLMRGIINFLLVHNVKHHYLMIIHKLSTINYIVQFLKIFNTLPPLQALRKF